MKQYHKVLVGLDIGTDSVGWCVADENSHIIKKNGKSLWGVRMFEEATPAAERRMHRANRRRLHRRKERIDLLRCLFAEEMQKADPSFFYRLDNSFYKSEDRGEQPFDFTLFNDRQYTDSQYFSEYPTIYHLRKALLTSESKMDIRMLYLALHHMIKYRGNFLNDAEEFHPMDRSQADAFFLELKESLENRNDEEEYEHTITYSDTSFRKLKEINEKCRGLSALKEQFNEVLNPAHDKFVKDVIVPLMVGGEVSLKKTGIKNIDSIESGKLCARYDTFDLLIPELMSLNPTQEHLIHAFVACRNIYQFFLLGKLLGSHRYLCDAMIERYDIHHDELTELKYYVRKNFPEKYDDIFRIAVKDGKPVNNYVNYIGYTKVNGETIRTAHVAQADFYKYLKKELNLENYKITEENKNSFESGILAKMENEEYLLRQNSSKNSVFPYQLNLMEMKRILEKQSAFYPFLTEKDEEGISVTDKIISLLTYKIPYYVGPLIAPVEGNERSKFSWIVRTEEKIYPWNFRKVVKLDETAKNFIYRMLNRCTYLPDCYCLPKNSLLFSYYDVLSVLNKTNINGAPISCEDKTEVIEKLFKKQRKVSKKDFFRFFKEKYGEEVAIATSNNAELREFRCNMASYYDFSNIFGEDFVKAHSEYIENIIRDIVVFEDKKILEDRLKKVYAITNPEQIKRIKGLTYVGYASISKELLQDLFYLHQDDETGEVFESKNIISCMEESNRNLQELLFDPVYQFQRLAIEYNKKRMPAEQKKDIDSYVENLGMISPGMKRSLIQAYKICEEIEKILGHRIDEYYVECTRTNKSPKGKKGEKLSRKDRLSGIYKEAIRTAKGEMKLRLQEMKERLDHTEINKFQSDKYYLYFTQLGKCMYTGDAIDLEDLANSDRYDIEHIYPQAWIKDDSFHNRVLVKREVNAAKSDSYPIPLGILFSRNGGWKKAHAFYRELKNTELISEEKYKRLTANELSDSELESFVNRQLVNTNQAVKGFINAVEFLKTDDTFKPRVIYSKAENIADFRKKYDIVKCREANNFHHAHDAYLNIVVGRAIDVYFGRCSTQNGREYLMKMHRMGYTTNPQNIFDQNRSGNKKDITEHGNIVWDYQKSLTEIKRNIYRRFDILTTKRPETGRTLFDKVTILPAGTGNIPVKAHGPLQDITKYGGFKQYAFGSYALLQVGKDVIMEAIPTCCRKNLKEYLNTIYKNYTVLIDELKMNTLFEQEKKRFIVTGKTGSSYLLMNMNERIFSDTQLKLVKKIYKTIEKKGSYKITGSETTEDINALDLFVYDGTNLIISPAANEKTKAVTVEDGELMQFYNDLIGLFGKELYAFSSIVSLRNSLIETAERFREISILGKCQVLHNLLDLLKCNTRKMADLTLLGLAANSGKITFSKKLKNCRIIYQSITGYYEKIAYEVK